MRIAVFVAAGLVVLTGFLHAQSDDDDEDEMDSFPLVPSGNSLRFGLRYVGGPKVAFHNVGTVPANVTIQAVSAITQLGQVYNDGTVSPDARTDASGHPANDGRTNTWSVNYASQITPQSDIAYHIYSTTSIDNETIKARNGLAEGWELQVGTSLFKIARKVDVSLVGGFTFSSFNSKRTSDVQAQLTTLTDTYSLNGQLPPATPSSQPTTGVQVVYDPNGLPKLNATGQGVTVTVDQSTLLSLTPTRTKSNTNADGTPTTAEVSGLWQIKGAYYTFRLGPGIQIPVTERFKLGMGFGGAVVFAGSTYTSGQTIALQNVTTDVWDGEMKTHSVLLPAFYADVDAEFWLTDRAGLYLGATYQKSQSFNQTVGGESASIDLGSASGITSGLTLRF